MMYRKGVNLVIKKTISVLICYFLLISTLNGTFQVSAASEKVTIHANSINVRSGAGLTYPVIASVKKGQAYDLIESKGDWYKIRLSGTKTGWVANWLVKKNIDNNTKSEHVNGSTVVSNTTGLRFRSGPGTTFRVIGVFEKGKVATSLDKSGDWIKISYKGSQGWVASKYVTYQSTTASNSTESSNAKVATVKAASLNIRKSPSTSSSRIGSLQRNAKVTVLKEENSWVQIRTSTIKGWVHSDYLSYNHSSDSDSNTAPPNQSGIVTASSINVRNSGNLTGKVIDSIKKGTSVTIIDEKNDWYKISYGSNKTGWVAGWYISQTSANQGNQSSANQKKKQAKIIYDGTNIRSGSSTSHSIVKRANLGDTYEIIETAGDWYKLKLGNNKTGYVAGWVVEATGVSTPVSRPGSEQYLKNQTIVIDPGHGGRDSGAVGIRGTLEKKMTLTTAKLVYDKLKSAGANVFMTRSNDTYVSLNSRVSTSHYRKAEAFISLHYDSINNSSVTGTTTYYYHSLKDGPLASKVNNELAKKTQLRNRGTKFGNFHVLRENKAPAILIELGYLSNQTEELTIKSSSFQERTSQGIYNGLAQYFKNN